MQKLSSASVEEYGWQSTAETCSGGYVTPQVLSVLNRMGVRRVLDLGAGNGALCGVLAAAGFEVVGVEYDRRGVEIATRSVPTVPFYNYGVQDDPGELLAKEQPFDAVVSTEVIEHLFAPHLLPAYAARVLSVGGYLILTTPYHGYLKNLILAILDKWDHHHTALWHGGHIKFFSRRTLTQLVEQNGFRQTEFHGLGRLPLLWKSMLMVARKS